MQKRLRTTLLSLFLNATHDAKIESLFRLFPLIIVLVIKFKKLVPTIPKTPPSIAAVPAVATPPKTALPVTNVDLIPLITLCGTTIFVKAKPIEAPTAAAINPKTTWLPVERLHLHLTITVPLTFTKSTFLEITLSSLSEIVRALFQIIAFIYASLSFSETGIELVYPFLIP